ncbi:large ribosomal subunit protein mL55-like isoform X2 [Physella acuta]|uniref:large ribosomal subunit protein mL55-like isoform X2 n=1 Tax=Physella acuta TaxID=109671 RepID=UPI0027DC17FD|nr:large ribosomal subunit protein mL55-like isoform X2 [Physella acuta]
MASSLIHMNRVFTSCRNCLPVLTNFVRNSSNAACITRAHRICYPRTYPTLLVFPDGSTINIRYKEPRRIIKLPLDISKLSDTEKKLVLARRKPKQKLEVFEDFEETFSVDDYSKFFKK